MQEQDQFAVEDASWLLDELSNLRRVLNLLPEGTFTDRPYGQPSMYDMLGVIGFAQENWFLPKILHWPDPVYPESFPDELSGFSSACPSDYFRNETDPERDIPVADMINRIVHERKKIMEVILSHSPAYLHEKRKTAGRTTSLLSIVQKMVRLDRLQLKKIAERLLEWEMERMRQKRA